MEPTRPPKRFKIMKPERAICVRAEYGPIFGGGYDLVVYDDANLTAENYSNLNNSYQANLQYESDKAQSYLCGRFVFFFFVVCVFRSVFLKFVEKYE